MAKRTESNNDSNSNDMPIVLNPSMFHESVTDNINRTALGHSTTDHDDSDDDSSDDDDVLGDDSLSNYASLEEVNDDSNLLLRDLDCTEGMDIKSLEMSPETNAKFQALLDAAGIGQFPCPDGRPLADPEVIRQLSNSVSCALDEAAAALGKLGDPDINIEDVTRGPESSVAVSHSNGPTVGCTPTTLAQACVEGNLSLVKQMLESGSEADEITQDGETPLTMAVTAGFTEIVEVLLKNGANPNLRGSKAECTALMEAASAGYVEIVFMLLQNGADFNAVSSTGNTALHYACCGGHEECLLVLLDHNADVEVQNENGHTALMEAASGGHVNLARHLLKHGAGINTHSTEFKESALTLACYKGHLEMVKFLLDSGADHEHKTDEMHTALMEAAMDGHVEVARLLLAHGAHVNMPADSFESPLTLAACGGHTELASLLLGHGADLEEVNDEGYTPLMEAAREGHDEMVALLLAHGADVNAQTQETQETALTLAACGGFVDVAELLLRCGADIELGSSTPLMEAAQEGHVELVKRLLAHGAKEYAETVTGDTALHYACENDHEEVCKILLDQGADIEHCSEGGRTPLMKAARAGKLRCVRLFISRCSNVNRTTTNNEYTALSLACANGHLMVVECLLKAGADPKLALRDGNTLLIEAAKGGHTDVTRLLLDFPNVDAETVQAQSAQAAAAAQATSGAAVPGALTCPSATPGTAISGSSGTVADRLPAEGLPSIVPPPPPNVNSTAANLVDTSGSGNKVAPPPLLPSSAAAAAASASTGIRPAPQRASAVYAPGYPTFTQSPHTGMQGLSSAASALVDEPWELPPSAGGAGGATSAAAVLDALPGDLAADCSLLEEFRDPEKLDELLARFMKIQEAATAGNHRNLRLMYESSESDCSSIGTLPPRVPGVSGHLQQQAITSGSPRQQGNGCKTSITSVPVSIPNLPPNPSLDSPLPAGASKEKLTAIFERTQRILSNPESTLTTPSPLQQRKWNVNASSVVANPLGKTLSSGQLAQALSTFRQQQQQLSLSMPLAAGDIPSLSTADNSVSSTTVIPPPPPPMTTSQLQQLEQQLMQTRQQIGDSPADGPVDNPLSSASFPGLTTAVSSVLAASSTTSTTLPNSVVPGNGVGLVPISNVTGSSTTPNNGINSNGSGGTSSSTPCYSPHSPCYPPQSPHNFTHNESNIDINAFTESTAETALTLAAQGGYEDLVRLLLDRGAYIEHRDNKGYTPLINAAINGHREVVRLLLDRQADMEAQSDRTKDTALSLACSGGRYDVAELLLQRHANKEHRNVSDYTPLSLAASGGYVNIINLLLKHGAEINSRTGSKLGISPLMLAAMNGHKEAVRVLLDNGSDINAMIETNRNTALTLACFQGRHEVVALLLERKALIEHRAKTGLTPLMEAASGGYVEVGRVLLEKGAEVNALPVPTSRDTALTIAADKGHNKFVTLLLEHGAHVEVKNKKGCSPLWLACNGGHIDVVQKLVQHSADVNSMDNRKTSCLMAAFRKGHLKVVKFLVKHVTQFPADNVCLRYIQTITDKELSKKCSTCMDIIVTAKDRQAAEANKNANNLLQELDNEKEQVAKKQAALAKKREKKRQKKIKAKEREKERVERPGEDDDDDIGSNVGGGLSSVAARGQSGFDTEDLEGDALNVNSLTGERESGDGGEMEDDSGGKWYKPSAPGTSEVQVESLWSRLSPLPPTEPKGGGGDQKQKKASKLSNQSSYRSNTYRKTAASSKVTSNSTISLSPSSSRARRADSPLEIPMGTPTATTAGTTGHNLVSTIVVSGGRQPRHNSNNNNAASSNESPKINSNMTAVEKKAAMARGKKKKASSPSTVASSSSQVSTTFTTSTVSSTSTSNSNRRKREHPVDKAPSRSPPPPPPPPSTNSVTTTVWSMGHPPSYSAAVAASPSGEVNGDVKSALWSSQIPTSKSVSVPSAKLTSQSPVASQSASPPIQPPTSISSQILSASMPDNSEYFELYTETGIDDQEGTSNSLLSSPLPSPGGPWITAGGRSSAQHSSSQSHSGGNPPPGVASSNTGGNPDHEWTTVAKRRISMPVSRREIGKVIGQSGTTINMIRQQSGAHIDIDNKESDNGERQVHIRGPVDAVNRAKTMIEHLISGKPLTQLLSMPATSQSAVPLMSGVSAAVGSGRKGSGASKSASSLTSSVSVKGSKPLPIRQQSRGAAVIAPPTSRVPLTRKGTASENVQPQLAAAGFTAWNSDGGEMNFASVAAAGVVRPVTNSPTTGSTPSGKTLSGTGKPMAGFPTLSESLSLTGEASQSPQSASHSPQQTPKPLSPATATIKSVDESPAVSEPPPVIQAVVQPMIVQVSAPTAQVSASTAPTSAKSSDFNRAPGSHRPKPAVAATSTTTTTTITTISSEPTPDLAPLNLNPVSNQPPVVLTHVSSSRASPSTSPYPAASTTPVPSTPLAPASPPVSRSAPSPPVAPVDPRPSQPPLAVVPPSITPATIVPVSSTSAPMSNLTASCTPCTSISPINVTHAAVPSVSPSVLPTSTVQVTSVQPVNMPTPVSYPPNLASLLTPPGLVSNAANDIGMTLPRISSLNPGANTFEPRAPSTIPPNIVPGAPQMMQSGHAAQHLQSGMRPLPGNFSPLTQQQQQLLAMENAMRFSGNAGNTSNYSPTGSDPSMMNVRGANDSHMAAAAAAAAASRAVMGNISSSITRNNSYYTGNIGSGMMSNPPFFGTTQQQQQPQQHGIIGSGNINRNGNSLAAVQHMYPHSQQQMGSGTSESGVNSPQQLLMLATDCLFNTNASNIDISNMGSGGNGPVDSHDSSNFNPFILGANSQTPFGATGNFNTGQDLMNFMTNGMSNVGNRGPGTIARPIGAERSIGATSNTMKTSNWTASMPQMPNSGSGPNAMYGSHNQQNSNLMIPQMNPGGGSTSTASGGDSGATHYSWGNSWPMSGSGGGSAVHPAHLSGTPGGGTAAGWPGSSSNMSPIPLSSITRAATLQSGWPSGSSAAEWPQSGPQQAPQRPQAQQQPSSHHLTDQ